MLQAQQHPRTSQSVTLPASLNTTLLALAKAQQLSSNPIKLQPKPQSGGTNSQRVSVVPSLVTKPRGSFPHATRLDTLGIRAMNLNVKVINPSKKSQCQTFVLRNVSSNLSTPTDLKEEILQQFGSDLVPDDLDFPIGYTRSGTKVWIRTASDVQDVWRFIRNSEAVSLWCHGVPTPVGKSQKDHSSDSDSDGDDPKYKKKRKRKRRKLTAFEEKNNRVEELVMRLRQKHGSRYSTIQYRIWAEVTDVGNYE